VAFERLPALADADLVNAWPAWRSSCTVLRQREAWRAVCADSAAVDARSAAAIRSFFAARFEAWRVLHETREEPPPGSGGPGRPITVTDRGRITGYYEPLLAGSRTPSARFAVPLHRVPDDLLTIDLATVVPELAGRRLRAGRVQLPDGSVIRVGYADTNGHPYRSIGRVLIDRGELSFEQASMQGIQAWARANPARLEELLNQNPSYVFFRELPLGDPAAGPVGAMNLALTPGYSVAADPQFVPLGAPVVLDTQHPSSGAPLARLMLVQDTGGAIRGPIRFDFFWGFGRAAAEHAGRQRHDVQAFVLAPRGVRPEALLR